METLCISTQISLLLQISCRQIDIELTSPVSPGRTSEQTPERTQPPRPCCPGSLQLKGKATNEAKKMVLRYNSSINIRNIGRKSKKTTEGKLTQIGISLGGAVKFANLFDVEA